MSGNVGLGGAEDFSKAIDDAVNTNSNSSKKDDLGSESLNRVVSILRNLGKGDGGKYEYLDNLADSVVKEIKAIKKAFKHSNGIYWEWKPQESIADWNKRDVKVGDTVLVMNDPESEEYRGVKKKKTDKRTGKTIETNSFVPGKEPKRFRFPMSDTLKVIGFEDDGSVRIKVKHDDFKEEEIVVPKKLVVHCHNGSDVSYPVLTETGKVVGKNSGNKPWNAVINADNLYGLQALCYAYEGKVDYIYIDPPYNTQDKSWIYNNDYVNVADSYKSSMWLTFMERRLRIAKRLLNPNNSVLCVAIDDTECWTVGNLLHDVFPEAKIQMVSYVTNPAGKVRPTYQFATNAEYLFFVRLSRDKNVSYDVSVDYWNRDGEGKGDTDGINGDDSGNVLDDSSFWTRCQRGNRSDRPNLFFPVYVDEESLKITHVGEPYAPDDHDYGNLPHAEGEVVLFPLKSNGDEQQWNIGDQRMRSDVKNGYVRVRRNRKSYSIEYLTKGVIDGINNGTYKVSGKRNDGSLIIDSVKKSQAKSLWTKKSHNNKTYGTAVLNAVLGRNDAFDFPKSIYSVEDALHIFLADKPDALIVDFFAGSGTTGQVVGMMNKRDGGHRQCILITNNEAGYQNENNMMHKGLTPFDDEWRKKGVCQDVTIPRIKSAVLGRTERNEPIKCDYLYDGGGPMSDGLEERWKFYDLTFTRKSDIETSTRPADMNVLLTVLPLFQMRAGVLGDDDMLIERRSHDESIEYVITKHWSIMNNPMMVARMDNDLRRFEADGAVEPEHHVIYNMIRGKMVPASKRGYTVVNQYDDYANRMDDVSVEIAKMPVKFRNENK